MSQRRYTYLVKEDILLLKRRYTAFWRKAHRTFMQSGMGCLMLLSLWLTACVGEELQKPLLGEGEGYLRLQVAPVSAEISTSPLTKAEIATPDKDDLTINIKQGDTSVTGFPKKYAELPDLLVLKVGTYTVEAYYGTDSTLQVKPYFHGSSEVTIQPNQNNDATINVVFANAMLVPAVDQNLAKHYSTWKLTASTSDKNFPFAEKDKTSSTLYAKAGETVTFTFSGTNKAEKEVSSSWDNTFDAGYAYQLQCNPNIDAFKSIKVNATAKHTYDVGGNLNGTDITFTPVSNGADLDAIQTWQVEVKYNNQTIRTYTGTSLDNMTCQNNDWPYIPKDCTLSASVTLKSKDEISDLKGTITSWQAPDFKVSVSAYTSYDKYLDHDITAANGCQPETMYDIKASAKIAPELLDNNNYTHSFQLLLDGKVITSSNDLTELSTEDKGGLSWASHTLKAVMTFGGSECSKESVHHITGLPYKAVPPKSESSDLIYGWTTDQGNAFNWTNTYLQLGVSGGQQVHTVYKQFYIPSSINCTLNARIAAHNAPVNTTCSILLGDQTIMSVYSNGGAFNYNTTELEDSKAITMTNSDFKIVLKNSYSVTSSWGRFYYVNINYR